MKIHLKSQDMNTLLLLLGYAVGASCKEEKPIPDEWKSVVDKIVVQLGGEPYWNRKDMILLQLKEISDY